MAKFGFSDTTALNFFQQAEIERLLIEYLSLLGKKKNFNISFDKSKVKSEIARMTVAKTSNFRRRLPLNSSLYLFRLNSDLTDFVSQREICLKFPHITLDEQERAPLDSETLLKVVEGEITEDQARNQIKKVKDFQSFFSDKSMSTQQLEAVQRNYMISAKFQLKFPQSVIVQKQWISFSLESNSRVVCSFECSEEESYALIQNTMSRLDKSDGAICVRDVMQTFISECSLGKNEMLNSWLLLGGKAVEKSEKSALFDTELGVESLKSECANIQAREVKIMLQVYRN